MPSPLGHALGGLAAGLLVSERRAPWRPSRTPWWTASPAARALAFAAIACLPDVDLLVGTHSAHTHSIGAVAVAAAVLFAWTRDARLSLAGGAAYASHLLFDWLGRDTSPPLGIMALWPFSHEYFMSPITPIEPVSRRYWLPGFWVHNLKVGLTELALFGSLAALTWWHRVSRRRSGG